MRSLLRYLGIAMIAGALVLSGCGGGGEGDEDDEDTEQVLPGGDEDDEDEE